MVTLELDAELEAAIRQVAGQQDSSPESLAISVLRRRFLRHIAMPVPRDEWEQGLLAIGRDCGASIPDSALTREEMYD